jgi:tight adherence protein B
MPSLAEVSVRQLGSTAGAIAAAISVIVFAISGVLGFALAAAVFALAALLELVRIALVRERARFSKLWPQVFDACYSAQSVGLPMHQQVLDLAANGPQPLRPGFAQLAHDLESDSFPSALQHFQARYTSREADIFATLLALDHELGGRGQRQAWRDAGRHLRESLKLASEIATKQGWVVGSAKLALGAPWLIAAILMQLGDNKAAFASTTGTAVLVFGLALSGLGYFLVNLLGRLPMLPRVLYAN